MSVITIFSSRFCEQKKIVEGLLQQTGYRLVTDDDVIERAAKISGWEPRKISTVFDAKVSVFNKFTHEKERSRAWVRLAIAELMGEDNLLIKGFCGLLIPPTIAHVLRVCLVTEMKVRLQRALAETGLSEKAASQLIHKADEDRAAWVDALFKLQDPWSAALYDIVIPTDKTEPQAAVKLISDNLRHEVIRPTDSSKRAAYDFLLASRVAVAMAKEGHNVDVAARDGAVGITINQNVLMLNRLEEELKSIAEKVDGVQSVETRIGKGFHQADIYRKFDFNMPKLLLVDDEREFVQTLSERLQMRDMTPAVAFDGAAALDIVNADEPEVMILDLKMPGIDGLEVLRRVKETRPEVEVIILTGHGTQADREQCMALGAFAYLQKPVDIEVLTETLTKAKVKMQANLARRSG